MTPAQQFYHGPREDGCHWSGPFDAREDAIADGRVEYEGERDVFYTCRSEPAMSRLDDLGDLLLERIAERLCDPPFPDDGPWDEWPEGVTKEQQARLDELVAAAVKTWLDETGHWPSWWMCEDIQSHETKEAT